MQAQIQICKYDGMIIAACERITKNIFNEIRAFNKGNFQREGF